MHGLSSFIEEYPQITCVGHSWLESLPKIPQGSRWMYYTAWLRYDGIWTCVKWLKLSLSSSLMPLFVKVYFEKNSVSCDQPLKPAKETMKTFPCGFCHWVLHCIEGHLNPSGAKCWPEELETRHKQPCRCGERGPVGKDAYHTLGEESTSLSQWAAEGNKMMKEAYIWKQNDVSGSKVLCINIIAIKQKAEGRQRRTNKQMKSWLMEVPGSAAGIIVNLHISLKGVFKNIFLSGELAKNNILAAAQLVKTSILARASTQCANVFPGAKLPVLEGRSS